jgi:4-hydroxy-tetrahydrodipicolinate synthase
MSDLAGLHDALSSPVPSIRTPFESSGDIDFASLDRIVDFCLDAGARALMLTAGDSHYLCLSDDEIADVTRAVCKRAAGKALVIAADRYHATRRAVAFATYARDVGADIVMCMPPDWGASCTERSLADHYAAVAGVMPVMIVTNLFAARGTPFGLRTIELAMNASPNVMSVKDDVCGEFARRLGVLAYGKLALVAGGLKENHLNAHPYGCNGYLSTFITFAPQITRDYWRAIRSNDLATARRIIGDYEMPLMQLGFSLPGGFDAMLHGVMELYGLSKRWRRPPYHSLTDQELDRVAGLLRAKGLSGRS